MLTPLMIKRSGPESINPQMGSNLEHTNWLRADAAAHISVDSVTPRSTTGAADETQKKESTANIMVYWI